MEQKRKRNLEMLLRLCFQFVDLDLLTIKSVCWFDYLNQTCISLNYLVNDNDVKKNGFVLFILF